MIKKSLAVVAVALATVTSANAATITNGSFELEALGNVQWQKYSTGDMNISGWTINTSVDLIRNGWDASDGSQSLDLIGDGGQGGVSQDITDLMVGTTYEVSFDYSGNAFLNQFLVGMTVSAGDESADYTYTTGPTTAIEWVEGTFTFTADATTETLSFFSDIGHPFGGVALDNVAISAISAVPLPAGGLLLLTGFGALAFARRKS